MLVDCSTLVIKFIILSNNTQWHHGFGFTLSLGLPVYDSSRQRSHETCKKIWHLKIVIHGLNFFNAVDD